MIRSPSPGGGLASEFAHAAAAGRWGSVGESGSLDCSTDRIDRTRIPRWMLIRTGSGFFGLPNNIPPAHPEIIDSGFVARKTPSPFMNGVKQL